MGRYATAQEVADFVGILDRHPDAREGVILQLGENTDPTEEAIETLVSYAESDIDRQLGVPHGGTSDDAVHGDDVHIFKKVNYVGLPIQFHLQRFRPDDGSRNTELVLSEFQMSIFKDSSGWEDVTYTDYGYLDDRLGIYYLTKYPTYVGEEVKIRLRYDVRADVPLWLKRLTILKCAVDLVNTSWSMGNLAAVPEGGVQDAKSTWLVEIESILMNHQAIFTFRY